MSDLCVRYLIQKHRELEAPMKNLEALLDQPTGNPSGQTSVERLRSVTAQFASLLNGLLRAKEEILFPALDSFLSSDTGPLAVLRSEHANLRTLLGSMRIHAKSLSAESGQSPDWEQFRRDAKIALTILRGQMYKEDRVFFPMVSRLLSPEQDAPLAERMNQIEGTSRPRLKANAHGATDARTAEKNSFVPNTPPQSDLTNTNS